MKLQRARFCNCCCRPAFTLVEVVASLMLVGTLLVGILTAHRRHTQQVTSAKERLAAIAAADKLLDSWRAAGAWGPTTSSGTFKNNNDLVWRWIVTTPPELQRVGAAKGRLEVVKRDSGDSPPLVMLELVTGSALSARDQRP
jgi:type II secretory pathway pseudopilin PulG